MCTVIPSGVCTLRPLCSHMSGPLRWPLHLAADAPAASQSPGKAGLPAGADTHLGAHSAEDATSEANPSLGSPDADGRHLPRSSGMGARHDSGGAGAGSATLESGGSGSGGATAVRRPGFSWTNKPGPTQQVWSSQACIAKARNVGVETSGRMIAHAPAAKRMHAATQSHGRIESRTTGK